MTSSDNRNLFRGTAWYYARYRPGYPATFFQHVSERFHLEGTGRLLDLGCGTGELAVPLARHFTEVVGMDPEPEMLAEASARSDAGAVNNVAWVEGGSDDLERLRPRLDPLRLVTMGRSFHWMDGDATLRVLGEMVVPDGGVVIAGEGCGLWNGTAEWQLAIKEVVQRWLGESRRAGSGTYAEPKDRWEVVLARSPFKRIEPYRLEDKRTWDIDRIIGCLYSTSFCSQRLLGHQRQAFEVDLRDTLLDLNPAGQFHEVAVFEAYLAWMDA